MARNMGKALSGLQKPGAKSPARRGTATMTIEPMPPKPKTFTDKNLELGYGIGGANGFATRGAKPGGTISPQLKVAPSAKPAGLVKA
jgi:hypothetical protein